VKSVPKQKKRKAYDKERNSEMGCADYRLCGVCHTHRAQRNVLHGNVGKCKNVKM
jgi:hypothetical protein